VKDAVHWDDCWDYRSKPH